MPDNNANDLYSRIFSDPRANEVNRVVNVLRSEGLQQGRDFEKGSGWIYAPIGVSQFILKHDYQIKWIYGPASV